MSGRTLPSPRLRVLPGARRLRSAAGYAYLVYFLALPVALLTGPWVLVATTGQTVTTAIKTTATIVGGAYLFGLVALLR